MTTEQDHRAESGSIEDPGGPSGLPPPVGASFRLRFWQLRFWRELVMVTVLYFAYEVVADATSGSHATALADALAQVHLERVLGLFHERQIQELALRVPGLAQFSNDYYANIHFVMPVVVLVWLWWRFPDRYSQWRNVLAWLTGISLIVFIAFPVLPPRLLPGNFGFVDTIKTLGGAGKLDGVLLKEVGAQYAAMPSLHVAWSLWCAVAMLPTVRHRWFKALLVADPVVTTCVVIVTGNHFFLDVFAGVVVLVMGVGLARLDWSRLGWSRLGWSRLQSASQGWGFGRLGSGKVTRHRDVANEGYTFQGR
ncbi:MAG: phosphatase PAP2 family protein [Acidimicrobiales bacterium]